MDFDDWGENPCEVCGKGCLYGSRHVECGQMVIRRDRERKMMAKLGLRPQPLSGGGWIHKEDGESDTLMAQLKSTEGKSQSITRVDLRDLLVHALEAGKVPVFVVDFVGDPEPWLLVRPSDLSIVKEGITWPS